MEEFNEQFTAAARAGDLTKAQELVAAQASPSDTMWALTIAAEVGHLEGVQYLVDQCGTGADARDNELVALKNRVQYGHVGVVQCLINRCGADRQAGDFRRDEALLWAAKTDSTNVVRYLAGEGGADLSYKNRKGCTALVWAAKKGHMDIVRYLAGECGADVNARNHKGHTALSWAARMGELSLITRQCGGGVNAAKSADGYIALIGAAFEDHLDVVQYLVGQCKDGINAATGERTTLIMCAAAMTGRTRVVRYLVDECGAKVDATTSDGKTSLLLAAKYGHLDAVQYLADQGSATVNMYDNRGHTALMWAAQMGHIDIVRYLADAVGADVNAKSFVGDTALMVAAEHNNIGIVQLLVSQYGVVVYTTNTYRRTALMRAAGQGNTDVVEYLTGQCGAKVNVKDTSGNTALMWTVENGHLDTVWWLADKCGADVNMKNNGGDTSLTIAVKNGQIEIAQFLVERGADVDAQNHHGYTALMNAVEADRVDIVQYLVQQCGADVNSRNRSRITAVRLAADRGYHDILQILMPLITAKPHSPRASRGPIRNRLARWTAILRAKLLQWPQIHRLCIGDTIDTIRPVVSTTHPSSCEIPPSEIELNRSCSNGNTGGDFQAKWLDADVVVKLYVPDASHSTFNDEVLLWQRLRHPNVVKMYGLCVAGPHLQFFVCEVSSKGSLIEYVKQANSQQDPEPLPQDVTRRDLPVSKKVVTPTMWKYLHEAALGLEYLHERGIVHGDLRCSNVLIGSDNMAKLSNFGLSGLTERSRKDYSGVVGSMRWQAAEVLNSEPPSFKSDVYSLGMCIVEAATGEKPWGDKDDKDAKDYKELWAPENDKGDWPCPRDVLHLVSRLCCQDPNKRMSLASVVHELECLAIESGSVGNQPEHDPADLLHEYEYRKVNELWLKLLAHMEKGNNSQ